MNIIEALRTGLPLRRPLEKHWGSSRSGYLGNEYVKMMLLHQCDTGVFGQPFHSMRLITETDLLADDWMVKEDEKK